MQEPCARLYQALVPIYTYTCIYSLNAQVPDLLCFADHRRIRLLICCLLGEVPHAIYVIVVSSSLIAGYQIK